MNIGHIQYVLQFLSHLEFTLNKCITLATHINTTNAIHFTIYTVAKLQLAKKLNIYVFAVFLLANLVMSKVGDTGLLKHVF